MPFEEPAVPTEGPRPGRRIPAGGKAVLPAHDGRIAPPQAQCLAHLDPRDPSAAVRDLDPAVRAQRQAHRLDPGPLLVGGVEAHAGIADAQQPSAGSEGNGLGLARIEEGIAVPRQDAVEELVEPGPASRLLLAAPDELGVVHGAAIVHPPQAIWCDEDRVNDRGCTTGKHRDDARARLDLEESPIGREQPGPPSSVPEPRGRGGDHPGGLQLARPRPVGQDDVARGREEQLAVEGGDLGQGTAWKLDGGVSRIALDRPAGQAVEADAHLVGRGGHILSLALHGFGGEEHGSALEDPDRERALQLASLQGLDLRASEAFPVVVEVHTRRLRGSAQGSRAGEKAKDEDPEEERHGAHFVDDVEVSSYHVSNSM